MVTTEIALHQVLFAERHQLATCNEVGAFECSSGRKGPARATVLLILHRCDRALGNPINRVYHVGCRILRKGRLASKTARLPYETKVGAGEFVPRQIGKLIRT